MAIELLVVAAMTVGVPVWLLVEDVLHRVSSDSRVSGPVPVRRPAIAKPARAVSRAA